MQRKTTIRPPILAQVVDALDQGVHRHLVLVVAVLLRARRRQAVALVDDEDGAAMFAGRRHHLLEGFRDQGAHLTDHAAAAHSVAQLEQDRVLAARLGHQAIGHALGHRRLSGPDVAVKDDQRVLLGDEVAQRQAPAVVLAVPAGRAGRRSAAAGVGHGRGRSAPSKPSSVFSRRASASSGSGVSLSKIDRLAHAAQSLRCMP